MQTEPIDILIALSHTWWIKGPVLIVAIWLFLGMKFIRERQVGIVVKRFGMRSTPWPRPHPPGCALGCLRRGSNATAADLPSIGCPSG
jgi:hypothetical protein